MKEQTTKEGMMVVSVTSVPGGKWGGYYTPALYVARRRGRDGVITWRHQEYLMGYFFFHGRKMITGHQSEHLSEKRALEISQERSLPYDGSIRHGTVAD